MGRKEGISCSCVWVLLCVKVTGNFHVFPSNLKALSPRQRNETTTNKTETVWTENITRKKRDSSRCLMTSNWQIAMRKENVLWSIDNNYLKTKFNIKQRASTSSSSTNIKRSDSRFLGENKFTCGYFLFALRRKSENWNVIDLVIREGEKVSTEKKASFL